MAIDDYPTFQAGPYDQPTYTGPAPDFPTENGPAGPQISVSTTQALPANGNTAITVDPLPYTEYNCTVSYIEETGLEGARRRWTNRHPMRHHKAIRPPHVEGDLVDCQAYRRQAGLAKHEYRMRK